MFFAQKQNVFLGSFWGGSLVASNPVFYNVFEGFVVSKNAIFGPSWTPPDTKTELWCEIGNDFRGFAFEPQKCPRQPKVPVKMDSSPPVMVPDNTHIHTHAHTHTFLCQYQTSNITKVIVVGQLNSQRFTNDLP